MVMTEPNQTPTLADLIRKLEEATEGSRELDAAIGRIMVAEEAGDANISVISNLGPDGFGPYDYSFRNYFAQGIKPSYSRVPRYTTSLDAALSLVPEGWQWDVKFLPTDEGPVYEARVNFGWRAIADSLPLALCIAALKARAS